MSLRAIAWQSPRIHKREEIASSYLLAMTYLAIESLKQKETHVMCLYNNDI